MIWVDALQSAPSLAHYADKLGSFPLENDPVAALLQTNRTKTSKQDERATETRAAVKEKQPWFAYRWQPDTVVC